MSNVARGQEYSTADSLRTKAVVPIGHRMGKMMIKITHSLSDRLSDEHTVSIHRIALDGMIRRLQPSELQSNIACVTTIAPPVSTWILCGSNKNQRTILSPLKLRHRFY